MAMPMPPNVKVDIYRTDNPSAPYTLGTLSAQGVPGYLQPYVQSGRHGTANWLKWTHILYVDDTVDVRDAYNTQLDPARNNNIADTVILNDPTILGEQTAFYVTFVERALVGSPFSHIRVYLDRFQPKQWPTQAL
jgi:hypothetical protein